MEYFNQVRERLGKAWGSTFGEEVDEKDIVGDFKYDHNGLLLEGTKWSCRGFDYELLGIQRSRISDDEEVILHVVQRERKDLDLPDIMIRVSVFSHAGGGFIFWSDSPEEAEEFERKLSIYPKMRWVAVRKCTVGYTKVTPCLEHYEWWICNPLVESIFDLRDPNDYRY